MHIFTAFLSLEEKMKLEEWRKEIDSIDAELVGLVNRRAIIAQKIGALKAAAGLPVVDEAREDEILRNATARNQGILKTEAIVRIFRAVIRESRNIQAQTQAQIVGGKRVL
jgi:chorismate mutase / prephenate dehydratase